MVEGVWRPQVGHGQANSHLAILGTDISTGVGDKITPGYVAYTVSPVRLGPHDCHDRRMK